MHDIRPCVSTPCRTYAPGHQLNPVHAGAVGRTPEGWRDGTITAIHDRQIVVAYLHEDASAEVWHHRGLGEAVEIGEPVAVHERYHAMRIGRRLLNVVVVTGAGGTPVAPAVGGLERQVYVVDLEGGEGVPLDPAEG